MFKNPFKKKHLQPSEHSMQVLVIDQDADTVSRSLGITDERLSELTSAMGKVIREMQESIHNPADVLAKCSTMCVHPNELAVVSYMLGGYVEKANSPLSFISRMFGQ